MVGGFVFRLRLNGTVLSKDFNLGDIAFGSQIFGSKTFTTLNGRGLFVSDNGEVGQELWVTEDSLDAVFLLKDISLGF